MLDVVIEVGQNVELPTPYEVSEVYLPKRVLGDKEMDWIPQAYLGGVGHDYNVWWVDRAY